MHEHIAYIGIGSNLGDRINNCKAAIQLIDKLPDTKVTKTSRFYETEAVVDNRNVLVGARRAVPLQNNYINAAIEIVTKFSPHDLLKELLNIEKKLGRDYPRQKNTPRTIDLDILFYDDIVINDDSLTIPHPEIEKRLFVLIPLCDIAQRFSHLRDGCAVKAKVKVINL